MKIQEQISKSKIELWKISDLLPYARNSRTHSDSQIAKVAASIKEFGFTSPILIKSSGEIIAGHCRLEASRKLKLDSVPCIVLDHLTDIQARAYVIADNQLALNAGWDEEMLKLEIEELDDADFDLDLLGFDDGFLDDLGIEDDDKPQGDPDAVPDVPKNIHGVVRGQIWQLGEHRLMCGDSTSELDVAKLMGGKKADMVFTDPPYNINFKPPRGTHEAIKNDNMSSEKFMSFLESVCENLKKFSKKDTYAFIWSGWSTIDQFAPVLRKFYEIKAMPIWIKNNFGIGYYSRPKYEPFFLCLNGEPKKPDQAPADVWEYAKVHETIHSCEKPVGLIEDILSTYTNSGFVLDLFGGSGSTMIACEKTKRINFSMELDDHYCSVIIERWQNYTGQKAILLEPLKTKVDELLSL